MTGGLVGVELAALGCVDGRRCESAAGCEQAASDAVWRLDGDGSRRRAALLCGRCRRLLADFCARHTSLPVGCYGELRGS